MGTNFYIKKFCSHCGHTFERHIGKSSMGWKFCFNAIDFKTKAEWYTELFNNADSIYDEYGDKKDLGQFKMFIESKRDGYSHRVYCEEHGYGPWDRSQVDKEWLEDEFRFYAGEFS